MSAALAFILACIHVPLIYCDYTIYNDSHQTIVAVSSSRLWNPIPAGGSNDDVSVRFHKVPKDARMVVRFTFKTGKTVTATLDPCRISAVRVNDTLATIIMPAPRQKKP